MLHAKSEKRRTERYDFPAMIEYVLGAPINTEVFKGVTINISNNGLSIYAFRPLSEGQRITIRSALPVHHRIATIRWIKKEDESMYKLGLKFSGDAHNPDERMAQA
jgi:hypothetical protein